MTLSAGPAGLSAEGLPSLWVSLCSDLLGSQDRMPGLGGPSPVFPPMLCAWEAGLRTLSWLLTGGLLVQAGESLAAGHWPKAATSSPWGR